MDKTDSAEQAVDLVRSGDRVWIHTGCATPEPLIEALARRAGICAMLKSCTWWRAGTLPMRGRRWRGTFASTACF